MLHPISCAERVPKICYFVCKLRVNITYKWHNVSHMGPVDVVRSSSNPSHAAKKGHTDRPSSNEYVPSQYGIRFAILRGYLLKYQKSHILCVSWKATLGNNGIVQTIRCLRILSNTPPTFLTCRMKIMTQSSSIVCLLSSYT